MNLNTLPWRPARPIYRWWKCTMYTLHACTPPGHPKPHDKEAKFDHGGLGFTKFWYKMICNSGHDTLNFEKYLLTYLSLEPQILQSFYVRLPLGGNPIITILSRSITFSTPCSLFFFFWWISQPGWKKKEGVEDTKGFILFYFIYKYIFLIF
jgi:hypothetical protein